MVDTPWLTPTEAAKYAKVHRNTIYAAIKAGTIPTIRIAGGRKHVIARADLETWIQSDALAVTA